MISSNRRAAAVQRVDGYYLYQVGSQIHPLGEFAPGHTTLEQARFPLFIAEAAIEPLITRSVFRLRTSAVSGRNLLSAIKTLKEKIDGTTAERMSEPAQWLDIYNITSALTAFEAVLGAELSLSPLYVVTPKAGFDMPLLIDNGTACFPLEVASKVPEAIPDLKQGTRCIAFELYTASGFHMHRANESVLHRYWDAVANGAPRPAGRNMGDYLAAMDRQSLGDPRAKAALRDLKDLHRNPLIHPEHSIENMDDAIALMNGVHNVMVHMLRQIPEIAPATSVPAGAVAPPS